jgi:hypothetical protein
MARCMESLGELRRANISEITDELAKEKLNCESKGEIEGNRQSENVFCGNMWFLKSNEEK